MQKSSLRISLKSNTNRSQSLNRGFSIVKLLVAITIIAFVVLIIFGYEVIVSSSLQSDLNNASQQLKMFQAENNVFPVSIDCTIPDSATNECIRVYAGTSYTYQSDNTANPQTFSLIATKNGTSYRVTADSIPTKTTLNTSP